MEKIIVRLGFVVFPPVHTCDGGNLSPEIRLEGLNASSVALMAVNPYEKGCSFCPWVIWNIRSAPVIPSGIPREPVTASPVEAVQGTNDYGAIGYTGPCPPQGQTHRYAFKVYGLDTPLDLSPGAGKHELIHAMQGHVLQFGETYAMYTR